MVENNFDFALRQTTEKKSPIWTCRLRQVQFAKRQFNSDAGERNIVGFIDDTEQLRSGLCPKADRKEEQETQDAGDSITGGRKPLHFLGQRIMSVSDHSEAFGRKAA